MSGQATYNAAALLAKVLEDFVDELKYGEHDDPDLRTAAHALRWEVQKFANKHRPPHLSGMKVEVSETKDGFEQELDRIEKFHETGNIVDLYAVTVGESSSGMDKASDHAKRIMSEARGTLPIPPIPEDLCGAYSADSDGGCVFTPHTEGKHSWEDQSK